MKTFSFFAKRVWFLAFFAWTVSSSGSLAESLNGMYLMTKFSGSSLETSGYYFTDAGEVFEKPTGGADFKTFKETNPAKSGRYAITGNKMRLEWGGGRAATESKYEKKERGCFYFNGGLFCPVKPFKKGETLEGTYSGGASAGVGTGAVAGSASSITFKKDGSYVLGRTGTAGIASGRVDAGASKTSEESGLYEVDGFTLTLKNQKGETKKVTVFPYEEGRIYFEGRMMKRI